MRVFHISMRSVGETSGLDVFSVGETSRSRFPVNAPPGSDVLPVGETSWSRCARRAGGLGCHRASERVSPALPIVKQWRFRSFRTYMSIATRVVQFSRSFRSLIKNTRRMSKSIKDLKDLRALRRRACYRH